MEENSNAVITVTATDADGDNLTYSITGGDDSGLFTIDPTTGALTLQAKTDGLTTTDSTLPVSLTNMVDNGDGTYTADIEVHPSVTSFAALAGVTIWFSFDSSEMSFTKDDVTITADGLLDQVTTLGDGRIKLLWADSTNTLEAGKIGTITFTPTSGATDPAITIEAQLTGGDKDSIDATKSTTDTSIYNFTIVRTNVDFENPVDSDTDNVYKVTIQVSDGENTASQDIEVTVTDVAESSKPSSANINDDNNPITDDNDDTPPDIDLPDWSLFVAGFNLGSIILPETVTVMEDSTLPDLSDLIGLIGDQSESLALDFDHIDSGDPVIASVKPVITDWISHTDPFLENDWNPITEELFYTTEVG
jgi:serralysin